MKRETVSGLILAGGLGSRMGGADKGLVELAGRPMVAHVLERLQPQVGCVLINANRNADVYAGFGLPVLADRLGGFVGPLAGLDAALNGDADAGEWVLTCPCDSPFLPLDLAARMLDAALAAGVDVAMASALGQYEPVFLLANRRAGASLARYLEAGGRKIDRWVLGEPSVVVDFSDCPEAFSNINTADELARHAPD
jgi:molybdenum cofactor guanylyltransferase